MPKDACLYLIPNTIGNLVNLISLNAGYNQLSGEIPGSIGNLVLLERLWLNYNNLSGYLPDSICNLTNVSWSPDGFDGDSSYVCYNQLCPPYPDCIQEDVGPQFTSECPEIDLGEVNFDGILNILDVINIINIILNNNYNELADLNQDGFVSVLDAIMVVNIIHGN